MTIAEAVEVAKGRGGWGVFWMEWRGMGEGAGDTGLGKMRIFRSLSADGCQENRF